jgi:hypothetical protein
MREIFKDINEYDGLYQVSNFGNVYSFKRNKLLKLTYNHEGYLRVGLFYSNGNQKKKLVHRLVAEAFLDKPDEKDLVCHKDGDRTNNRLENLYWGDYQDNWNDTVNQGMSLKGTKHPKNKLTEKQVLEIYSSNKSIRKLAKEYNIHQSTVSCIKTNRNWSWLTQGGVH